MGVEEMKILFFVIAVFAIGFLVENPWVFGSEKPYEVTKESEAEISCMHLLRGCALDNTCKEAMYLNEKCIKRKLEEMYQSEHNDFYVNRPSK